MSKIQKGGEHNSPHDNPNPYMQRIEFKDLVFEEVVTLRKHVVQLQEVFRQMETDMDYVKRQHYSLCLLTKDVGDLRQQCETLPTLAKDVAELKGHWIAKEQQAARPDREPEQYDSRLVHPELQVPDEPGFKGNGEKTAVNDNNEIASIVSSPDVLQYEFQETVWDAALFIFAEPMGIWASFTMSLLLCFNIGMQALYTAIVVLNFTDPPFEEEDIIGFGEFRNVVAHDIKYVDPLTKASLAAKVCNLNTGLEVAGQQLDALSQIRDYMPDPEDSFFGKNTGQLMCWLACITWTFNVMKEVRTCLSLALAVLKHGGQHALSSHTKMVWDGDTWILAQISWERFLFMFFVLISRFAASAVLLWSGLKFLVSTIALTDLVLNAIALDCVLSLDEIIFEPFAPARVRSLLSSLQVLPCPSWCHAKGADLLSLFAILGSAVVLVCFVPSWLAVEVDNLTTVSDALCGGSKDFVTGTSQFVPFYVWAPSKDPTSDVVNQYAQDLTNAIIKGPESELWNLASMLKQQEVSGSYWSAGSVSGWSIQQASSRWNNHCDDIWDQFAGRLDYSKAMIFKDVKGATGCHDLEPFCDDDSPRGAATRGICPVTCGCDSPTSKLVLRAWAGGCPQGCELSSNYQIHLAEAECDDVPLTTLQNDPNWKYMASKVPEIAERALWPEFLMYDLNLIKNNMLEYGCDAVRRAREENIAVHVDLCDEGPERGFPYRSVRLFCPVTCNCTTFARNCPGKCPVRLIPRS